MSRVEFKTQDNREVGGGWDPEISKYFLTIFENFEPTLNVDSDNLEELQDILAANEIEPPEGFWEYVKNPKEGVWSVFRWNHKKRIWENILPPM